MDAPSNDTQNHDDLHLPSPECLVLPGLGIAAIIRPRKILRLIKLLWNNRQSAGPVTSLKTLVLKP